MKFWPQPKEWGKLKLGGKGLFLAYLIKFVSNNAESSTWDSFFQKITWIM